MDMLAEINDSFESAHDKSEPKLLLCARCSDEYMISRDLKELVKAGKLVNLPDITSYKITDKGLKFLELSEKMNDLINI